MAIPLVCPQNFYDSGPVNHIEKGRIVLFSYHYPPDEAAGALRWQKLAAHAVNRGWGLDVITRDPSELVRADLSRLQDLPPGIRLFGVRQPVIALQRLERHLSRTLHLLPRHQELDVSQIQDRPTGSSFGRDELRFDPFSLRNWARSYHVMALTMANLAWARSAARLAQILFERPRHKIAISCGPPHGVHQAARVFSRVTGVPFAIDMRDLWSLLERWIEPHATPVAPWIARFYERRFVRESALVIVNTEPARIAMQGLYPSRANRIITIMNGYDDDEAPPVTVRDSCFRIAYAGTIYLDRNPGNLFRAAGNLIRELRLEPNQLVIEFMGPPAQLDGSSIEELAQASGIERFVKVFPPGTRREASEFLARATLLVNLPQDSHVAIPSKVFEYMRYEAFLLALAERGSATEMLLRDTAADIVEPNDVERLTNILRTRFQEFREGRVPTPLTADGRFSRRSQAERLFDRLEAVLVREDVL